MATLSKTQIDRLGDRLKKGSPSEADLQLLDEYRRSFSPAYDTVVSIIRGKLQLEPTGRPTKSTSSIVEKLQRESVRLSQIQDIAGCRVVLPDMVVQDHIVDSIKSLFREVTVVDRRVKPSYGYRAVHVIVRTHGKVIEIQVRSTLQHIWAAFSERLSDRIDPNIKYGGGRQEIRDLLSSASKQVEDFEVGERLLATLPDGSLKKRTLQQGTIQQKQSIFDSLARLIFLAGHLN